MTMNYGSNLEKSAGDIMNQQSFALWVYGDVITMP